MQHHDGYTAGRWPLRRFAESLEAWRVFGNYSGLGFNERARPRLGRMHRRPAVRALWFGGRH